MSPRTAGIIVASTRAAAGAYEDECAPLISEWLAGHGLTAGVPQIVADGEPVRRALRKMLDAAPRVIVTSGGTGLAADDRTPEITAVVLERELPGVMEAIRAYGRTKTPLAALSRGVAGTAGSTFVVNLPGSPGGVRDGLAALDPLIGHICAQLEGNTDAGHAGPGDTGRTRRMEGQP
ncbi:molybdenum cofactor synthesis domain-containing protein [Arthrobacter sp.]|uniref:MogA/MoaB family molybdenum cofactor biosynthesis protein n=1 Tax=Arthrobacter sp. TaxID=1667 RepID=UPI003397D7AE